MSETHFDNSNYVIIHDLSANIRAIRNSIKWIEESIGNEMSGDDKKLFQIVSDRSEKLDALVKGLNQYLNCTYDDETISNIKIDEVINNILIEENFNSIPVSIELKLSNFEFHLYKNKLNSLLTQLIRNAINYCDQLNPKVEIIVTEDDNNLYINIKNNGIVNSISNINSYFRIYYSNHGQSGVGLSIAKRIIQCIKGEIKLDYQPNSFGVNVTWPKYLNL